MNLLFAMTTYNQVVYTNLALQSLKKLDDEFDLIVIDDVSSDRTVSILRDQGVEVITKDRPMGLTHSWNLAYQEFITRDYDALVIANNDILVPRGALHAMTQCLHRSSVVVPMTTQKGCGHNGEQSIHVHNTMLPRDEVDDAGNYQRVQYRLRRMHPVTMRKFNGFFFMLGKSIKQSEYKPGILFDPKQVNVGNEDDLNRRLKRRAILCRTAFIYHFKGVSFMASPRKIGNQCVRNDLSRFR